MNNPQLGRDLDALFKAQQQRIENTTAVFIARARIRRTERLAETLRAADADLRTGNHASGPRKPTLGHYDNQR